MATTTDTLIYELKVKDEASKVFDAWEKRLKDLEKTAKDINISETIEAGFKKVADIKAPFHKLVSGAGKILKSGFTSIFTGLVGIASSAFTKILDVGIASMKKVAGAVVGFVEESIGAYMSFEDQLALVGKTTGLAGKDLKDFGAEIRKLAKPIGSLKAENLLEVAEVAGQLGIETKNIAAFSVEIGKGAIALTKFGGSTEKLATAVAKQQNVFGLAADSADNLLSVMDAMSKSTAANELQISNFNVGMARVASTMKVTAAESSALGSVLIAGGLDASSASRLLSSSLVDLSTKSKSLAAATKIMQQDLAKGGEGIAKLEEITGRSRESFASLSEMIKTSFGVDAVQSMLAVSGAFSGLDQSAQKTELAYDAVGKTGLAVMSLLGEAVNRSSDDVKSMEFALNTANDAFQSGTSHMASYDAAMAKTSEKVKLFGSILDSIKLVIGEVFVQAIGRIMDKLNAFANEVSVWVDESEAFQLALNDVVRFLEQIADFALDVLIEQFRSLVSYIEKNGVSAWEKFVEKIIQAGEKAKTFITGLIKGFQNADPETFAKKFNAIVSAITAIAEAAASLGSIFNSLRESLNGLNIAEHLQNARDVLGGIADILKGDVLGGISRIASAIKDEVLLNVKTLGKTFKNILEGILKLGISVMEKIGESVVDKIGGALKKVGGFFTSFGKDASKEIDKVTKSTDDLDKSIEEARKAQAQFGKEGYGNSVWPDTAKYVGLASKSVEVLDRTIEATTQSMQGIGNAAKALSQNIPRYTPPTTIANASGNYTDYQSLIPQQPASTAPQTEQAVSSILAGLKPNQSVDSQSTTQTQTTNITFSGYNVVDESSKNRFAREITSAQRGLSSLSVRA